MAGEHAKLLYSLLFCHSLITILYYGYFGVGQIQESGLQRVYNERNMSLETLPNRDQGVSVNGKRIN